MDVVGCWGCDLQAGRIPLPGGVLYETVHWVVNHAVGPMNLGTLVVSPKEHVVAVARLDNEAAVELGALLKVVAEVVEELWAPEQVYVCTWSHGPGHRRHLHTVVQPVTTELVSAFGGKRSEQLQAALMLHGEQAAEAEVEAVCIKYRALFLRPCPQSGVLGQSPGPRRARARGCLEFGIRGHCAMSAEGEGPAVQNDSVCAFVTPRAPSENAVSDLLWVSRSRYSERPSKGLERLVDPQVHPSFCVDWEKDPERLVRWDSGISRVRVHMAVDGAFRTELQARASGSWGIREVPLQRGFSGPGPARK